ncbi:MULTISPECIES: flagellar hook-associated protein FlgL [Methylotenera]|uniref:flagellar hook-associated protein FlgL n=1 Tax=Methylotenera TaxID=359407 RepID=UPI00037932D7|nr:MULTISPECIES: flagellar hook-associated protein FlgL [Methylotenera]
MRISTNTIYQSGINRISELQSDQSRRQQQISTGKRILSPSDDPIASSRALEIKQALSTNAQLASNRVVAQNQLSMVDNVLGSVSDLVLSVQSTLVSAGNSSYSNSERSYMASEIRASLDQLIGLANTKDGAGHYLFSGFENTTPTYVKSATGATYQGDDNQQYLQVSNGRKMAISDTGKNIFQGNGLDAFKTLNDLANLLDTPIDTAADRAALTAGLATADTNMYQTLDNILNSRAIAGTKLKELDGIEVAGQDAVLQMSKTLSGLEDLDYAQALSDLTKQQTILTAAQQSFVKTTSLSLFNYI